MWVADGVGDGVAVKEGDGVTDGVVVTEGEGEGEEVGTGVDIVEGVIISSRTLTLSNVTVGEETFEQANKQRVRQRSKIGLIAAPC